jgi:5'-nucleotidase
MTRFGPCDPGRARQRIVAAVAALAALFVLTGGAVTLSGQPPYRILVTNDDGVRSPGLAALAQALAPLGEITIVAPAENQSGTGHAITLNDPIYIERVDVAGHQATGLVATPATCVRVALGKLMQVKPDLVVSGVNRGSNFGLNAYISGTVAAAR